MTRYLLPRTVAALACCAALALVTGCATMGSGSSTRTTERDKTKKGAVYGAIAGGILGAVLGEGEGDEILAGAAIGAGIGAGIGSYMDKQEEKLARIPGTTVERVGEDMLLVHFQSDLLFEVNSANLSYQSQATLDDVAGVLGEFNKTAVVIQGHTDSTGSEEYNQRLSERRAKSVKNYLTGRGIDPDRMISIGYGEGHPVADNASHLGRQQNRRVDILLKAKAS